jgi:hypothetical protein
MRRGGARGRRSAAVTPVTALLFAVLAVWIRGRVGGQSRKHHRAGAHDGRDHLRDVDVSPRLVVLSWCATALLAVPALVAVTAAWPLTEAVVCAEQVNKKAYSPPGAS